MSKVKALGLFRAEGLGFRELPNSSVRCHNWGSTFQILPGVCLQLRCLRGTNHCCCKIASIDGRRQGYFNVLGADLYIPKSISLNGGRLLNMYARLGVIASLNRFRAAVLSWLHACC